VRLVIVEIRDVSFYIPKAGQQLSAETPSEKRDLQVWEGSHIGLVVFRFHGTSEESDSLFAF
jgi:hypothetical protein